LAHHFGENPQKEIAEATVAKRSVKASTSDIDLLPAAGADSSGFLKLRIAVE
jgi:hypothetical protein